MSLESNIFGEPAKHLQGFAKHYLKTTDLITSSHFTDEETEAWGGGKGTPQAKAVIILIMRFILMDGCNWISLSNFWTESH